MFRLIFFIFIGVTLHSQLSAKEWEYDDLRGHHYLVSYKENGNWYLDHYTVRPGKLQERTFHKSFPSNKELNLYVQQNHNSYDSEIFRATNKLFQGPKITSEGNDVIWHTENQWDENWEYKYSKWIEENLHKDFFLEHELATDCADVAYALRWIFARINHLPAANTLAGSKIIFSNESIKQEWIRLKTDPLWYKDKRFLASLNYLLDNTYTHTLFRDSYPVAISKNYLLAGVYLLQMGSDSGHTMIISKTNYHDLDNVPIQIMASTVPRDIRELNVETFLSSYQPANEDGGFMQMRWPQKTYNKWQLIHQSKMPGYSLEQFDKQLTESESNFAMAIFKKLIPHFDPLILIGNAINGLVNYIKLRNDYVNEGYLICQKEDCSPGTENWEAWSTPSRDKRIVEMFKSIEEIIHKISNANIDLRERWNKNLKEELIEIKPNHQLTLGQIRFLFSNKVNSSDPRDSIERRWSSTTEATAQNITKIFIKAIKSRATKISNSNPSSDRLLSEGWMKKSTFEEDKQIHNIMDVAYNYNKHFSSNDQTLLYDLLEKKDVTIRGETRNVLQWFLKAAWFVSDSQAPENIRWGDHSSNYKYQILPKFKEIQISKNGIALVDKKSIINLENQHNNEIPENTIKSIINPENGMVIAVAEHSISLFNPASNSWTNTEIEPLHSGNTKVIWNEKNFFTVSFDDSSVRIYQIMKDCHVQTIKSSNQTELISSPNQEENNKQIILLNLINNNYTLIDFTNNQIKTLDIQTSPDTFLYQLVGETNSHYIVNGNNRQDNADFSYFIDKTNGKAYQQLTPNFVTFAIFREINKIITYASSETNIYKLISLDENGHQANSIILGHTMIISEAHNNNSIHYISAYNISPDESSYFRISNLGVEKYNPQDQQIFINGFGDLISTINNNYQQTVTDFDNNINIPFTEEVMVNFANNLNYDNIASIMGTTNRWLTITSVHPNGNIYHSIINIKNNKKSYPLVTASMEEANSQNYSFDKSEGINYVKKGIIIRISNGSNLWIDCN